MGNERLKAAVYQNETASKAGVLERLFTFAFKGFVYPQIWEDPDLDLAALDVRPDHRMVTIASGGCNVLSYLTANPRSVVAVDINPAHVALTKLKLAAVQHLPGYESFFRFFGYADERANTRAYDRFLSDRLDRETRAYWESRKLFLGRRINLFARNVYRFGLLGRFIGTVHFVALLYGKNPRRMLTAQSLEEQRWLFENTLAPMFDTKLIRFLCKLPVTLYGLGIPPAQYKALAGSSPDGNMAEVLCARVERLACGFPLEENYFAWQAFGRRYDRVNRKAVPPYLQAASYERVKERAARVEVATASMTEFLAGEPDASIDRYVLLDAQDWMTAQQMSDLWAEITRTATPGARVIFRTAGEDSPLPEALPGPIMDAWTYDEAACRDLVERDRSSIYGGVHLYTLAT